MSEPRRFRRLAALKTKSGCDLDPKYHLRAEKKSSKRPVPATKLEMALPKPKPRKDISRGLKETRRGLDSSCSGEVPGMPSPIDLSKEGEERFRAIFSRADDPDEKLGRMGRAGFAAVCRIFIKWGLSLEDQRKILGIEDNLPVETLGERAWDRSDMEVLERLSHVLGIYKLLNMRFPTASNADGWIKRPNSATLFEGRMALDVMKEGTEGLRAVRIYLENEICGFVPMFEMSEWRDQDG